MDLDQLITLRRDLHQHAEPAFLEYRTAEKIEQAIAGLPITVRRGREVQDQSQVVNFPTPEMQDAWADRAVQAGSDSDKINFFREQGTAMVAEIEGNRPGPVWGLRTDIDALPIREADDDHHFPAREGFNSHTPAMHACGHDGHAAIGVGLLHRLSDHDFPGTVRIYFQPAEEGSRGAKTMILAGALTGVDRMLGVHLTGGLQTSTVVGSVVGGMATDKLKVIFRGIAAHASGAPQQGRNALLAAATASLGIMSLPRYSGTDTRLNVGTLHAGDNHNIVPAYAEMTAETRANDDTVVGDLTERAKAVIAGAAMAYGVEHEVQITGSSVTIDPDAELVDLVLAAAGKLDGLPEVMRHAPQGGSDDVNLMIREVQRAGGQGAYVNVGCSSPASHHNPYFDAEEASIGTAVDLLETLFRAG